MDSDFEDVGLRLKTVRKLLKIKQDVFAKTLNIDETSLSDYEEEKKYPPFEFLRNISAKYNVSVEYLVLGKGEPFIREKSDFDNFLKDESFGDYTDEVIRLFGYMKRSKCVMHAVMAFFYEYLFKNGEYIEKDI
jgi:transcriptional regulator with XRE-family HTH domain